MSSKRAYIAANRFGYGANQRTIEQIQGDPLDWLVAQLSPDSILSEMQTLNIQWDSKQAAQQLTLYRQQRKQERKKQVSGQVISQENMMAISSDGIRKNITKHVFQSVSHVISQQIVSSRPFFWRLVDFFSNHFSVTANGLNMRALAQTLELEAIASNLSGNFSDMLIAVESHPAMLVYLNNEQSVGPNSKIGKRSKGKKGLNENLAREILELHTLGVNAGYNQADVTELAKAITGWSLSQQGVEGFEFRKQAHEPGSRDVFGKTYAAVGVQQGKQILFDLSNSPHTAKFVSEKLAKHFISDNPPTELVNDMVKAWLKTAGSLPHVVAAMLKNPLSWSFSNAKFKTPREFLVSTCRACELNEIRPDYVKSLTILGQQPFSAGSPAGFKDSQEYWAGPRAMMGRIEWADHVSKFVKSPPLDIARQALGPFLHERTIKAMSRAESKRQAISLMLLSPEFQKR